MINEKCKTEFKQTECYNKYQKKQESGGYMYQRPQKQIKQTQNKIKVTKPLKRTAIKKKFKIDEEYENFRREVWQRDAKCDPPKNGIVKDWRKFCTFWICLTQQERLKFLESVNGNEWMLNTIQVAHIKPKGAHADLKYDPNNAVLCNFYAHSLLDTHKDPITKLDITKEQREEWFKRMLNIHKTEKEKEELLRWI